MRTERYKDLVPPERLAATRCTVIGVGAIGRQVALQLAAMGAQAVQVIDHDRVEEVNLGPQGYCAADVGELKVEATARLMAALNPELAISTVAERFARTHGIHPNVFCCVDSIATRRHVWNAVQNQAELFIDGRMAAEVVRVLAAGDRESRAHYPGTLFDSRQAFPEPCTARSTIYSANIAAGLMVAQLARWLRGMPTEADQTLNLLSAELTVA